jgi:hypothetical protein
MKQVRKQYIIVLSVLLRFTDSDYPFGITWQKWGSKQALEKHKTSLSLMEVFNIALINTSYIGNFRALVVVF